MKPKPLQKGDRVVDPKSGQRGVIVGFQEPNRPWHDGGCPIVEADDPTARNAMGMYWHYAVHESEAKTCGTCGGVLFTPTCNHDAHVEARLVESIVAFMTKDAPELEHGDPVYGMADEIAKRFHPKHRK